MNYSNSKLDFKDNQNITNAKTTEFTHYSVENSKTHSWAAQKCKAEIMQQWDVTNYPFDKQKLRIEIEDAENDSTQMIYIVDSINSKLDPCFASEEWDIVKFTVKDQLRTYATNYGNPLLKGTST